MAQATKTLDIIIVNWNAGRQLRDCLQSIQSNPPGEQSIARVVIVDNASRDGSCEGLNDLSLPITIERNAENRGFAAACNQGASASSADFLLFLNPDTRLNRTSLTVPLRHLESSAYQGVGICGVQLLDDDGQITRSCTRFPRPRDFISAALGLDRTMPNTFPSFFMRDWDHRTTMVVDHVIGAFYLVRRRLFEDLRGFDERFFLYLEDLDFSLRAHQKGWSSLYVADACAYHRGGGTSSRIPSSRLFFALRSRILYAFKHFSMTAALALTAVTLVIEPLTRLALALSERSPRRALTTAAAFAYLWADLPSIAAKVHKGVR